MSPCRSVTGLDALNPNCGCYYHVFLLTYYWSWRILLIPNRGYYYPVSLLTWHWSWRLYISEFKLRWLPPLLPYAYWPDTGLVIYCWIHIAVTTTIAPICILTWYWSWHLYVAWIQIAPILTWYWSCHLLLNSNSGVYHHCSHTDAYTYTQDVTLDAYDVTLRMSYLRRSRRLDVIYLTLWMRMKTNI